MRIISVLLALSVNFGLITTAPVPKCAHKRVAYYPCWVAQTSSYTADIINASEFTHIIYAFVTPHADGSLVFPDAQKQAIAESNFKQLAELKKKNPHLKTLISIGGGTHVAALVVAKLAGDAQARDNFARSCFEFCAKYAINGIDIDWEYPRTVQEKNSLTELIKAVAQICKKADPDFIITLAGPVNFKRLAYIDLQAIEPYINWINIMTYDFHGPWPGSPLDAVTNHLAPLFSNTGNPEELCIESAIEYYLRKKIGPEKLVLGVPLYGRSFGGVKQTPTGLFSRYTGPGSGLVRPGIHTLSHIQATISKTHKLYWDEKAHASYYYNEQLEDFVSCETKKSLACKAAYIRSRKLAGVMFWALYNNDVIEYANFMCQALVA